MSRRASWSPLPRARRRGRRRRGCGPCAPRADGALPTPPSGSARARAPRDPSRRAPPRSRGLRGRASGCRAERARRRAPNARADELLEALRARAQRRPLDRRPGCTCRTPGSRRRPARARPGRPRSHRRARPARPRPGRSRAREHVLQGWVAAGHGADDEVAGAERGAVLLGRARRRAHGALRLRRAQGLGRHRLRPGLPRLEPPLAQLARLVERCRDPRGCTRPRGVSVGVGACHPLLPGPADLVGALGRVEAEQPLRSRDLNAGRRATRHALRVPRLRVRHPRARDRPRRRGRVPAGRGRAPFGSAGASRPLPWSRGRRPVRAPPRPRREGCHGRPRP